MEARVYLCHDELQRRQRTLASTRTSRNNADRDLLEQQQQSLKREYMAMQSDIQQLADEWESGRNALETLLTPTPPPMIDTLTSTTDIIPSPLPSPTMTPTTIDHAKEDRPPFILTTDESADLYPLPSKAFVYESTLSGSPHNSRSERITDQREQKVTCPPPPLNDERRWSSLCLCSHMIAKRKNKPDGYSNQGAWAEGSSRMKKINQTISIYHQLLPSCIEFTFPYTPAIYCCFS